MIELEPRYYDTTKIGDEFESRVIGSYEPVGRLSDAEFAAVLLDVERERQAKALRMFNLWREGRLPADVVVIEVPIERTEYGDFRYRLPVYGALPTQVLYGEQEPFSLERAVAVKMHRYADGAGGELVVGWNEYPPRLIVGWNK